MIRFACPRCQRQYEFSDLRAGAKFACHACGQRVQVPHPPGTDGSCATTLSTPAACPERPAPSRPVAFPTAFWWLAGCCGLVALAGCFLLLLPARGRDQERTVGQGDNHPRRQESAGGTDQAKHTPVPQSAALAAEAFRVLRSNCYRCHGEDGAAEGGLNYILDRDRLVARRKLVPGDPAASKLLRRVRAGEMPPPDEGPRPSAADLSILEQWIAAGAPPPASDKPTRFRFVSDGELVSAIHADLFGLGERDRRFARYFTLTHLANAGLSDDELQTYRHALARLVNGLSWHRRIRRPRPVGPAGTVLRVDIRDYQWSDRSWQRILDAYPHAVLHDSTAARECYAAAGGQLPYVRADWFVSAASRPPLYHDLLQLPDSEQELQRQLHIDVAENVRQERAARAGFNSSGVSRNNRLIERHDSPYGAYWRSYDFRDNVGRRNLFAHPLGPGGAANPFEHDGGEIIFSLPNGLHGFMLVDERGRRLDKAPLAIVSDPRRPDRAVQNGISCMNCHARGLIPKSDQVRTHVEQNPNAFSPAEAEAVKALYPPEAELADRFARDNERFRKAAKETGGRLTATAPVPALVRQYEKEMDLATAAAELGLTPDDFSRRLNESDVLSRTLGPLRIPGGTVKRQVFVEAFPDLVRELELGVYLPPARGPRSGR